MRVRYIIYLTVAGAIHLFFWYYTVCFCGVYTFSNRGWVLGWGLSLLFEWVGWALLVFSSNIVFWFLGKKAKAFAKPYFFARLLTRTT